MRCMCYLINNFGVVLVFSRALSIWPIALLQKLQYELTKVPVAA